MDSGVTYGRWLRSKRGRKGAPGFLSQDALAERVGVQRTYVNQIENGRVGVPDPPLRQRIHAALGTTEEELRELGIVRDAHGHIRTGTLAVTGGTITATVGETGMNDAFIRSLSPEQRRMLRDMLDAADEPHPDDPRIRPVPDRPAKPATERDQEAE